MTKILIAIITLLLLTQVAIAQDDELVRLMKYQLEAKDTGIATLIAVSSPLPGIAHYYVGAWDEGQRFLCYYLGLITLGVAGLNWKDPIYTEVEGEYSWETKTVKTGEELSTEGAIMALICFSGALIVKVIEPFDVYKRAVEYNKKLLEKYKLNFAIRKTNNTFTVTYCF